MKLKLPIKLKTKTSYILINIIIFLYLDKIIYVLNKLPTVNINGTISINDRILLITLMAILWYSLETRRMRVEVKQQNKPYIQLNIDSSKNILRAENIGKDDAHKIEITLKDINNPTPPIISRHELLGVGKKINLDLDSTAFLSKANNILINLKYTYPLINKEYKYKIYLSRNGKGELEEKLTN